MKKDFLEGFNVRPKELILLKSKVELTCPAPPATTKVSAEGRSNYSTLPPNSASGYGVTGLMAMNTWQSSCYGEVRPGYIFLFPGIYNSTPPTYKGTVYLNCSSHVPVNSNGGTLHGQMCSILGRPTTDFIGFACNYPFDQPGNMGYHSWTCNPHWFNGSNEIPSNCNGLNWQSIVFNTLKSWLPNS